MSKQAGLDDDSTQLNTNPGATAAAIQVVITAGASGSLSGGTGVLDWVLRGDNFIKLRDKIKESAAE